MKKIAGLRIAKALVRDEDECNLMALFLKMRVGDMLTPDTLVPRKGEYIAVFDLRVFGLERKDWLDGLRKIAAKGATLVQIDRVTGAQGIIASDSKGAELLVYTIERDAADKRMPREKAKERSRLRWEKLVKSRLPEEQAKTIWFNPKFTVEECLSLMKGWTNSHAYRTFGRRDKKSGPPPKPKKGAKKKPARNDTGLTDMVVKIIAAIRPFDNDED